MYIYIYYILQYLTSNLQVLVKTVVTVLNYIMFK